MKDRYKFEPDFDEIDFIPDFSQSVIKKEPMLFSCDTKAAMLKGGEITKQFIKESLYGHDDWIIDSRVHMLMPTWYPCIPGWHHDDVPRSTPSGQPNYDTPEYRSEHIMMVMGPTAMPEFLQDTVTLPRVSIESGEIIYKCWDSLIENHTPKLRRFTLYSGQVIRFSWQAFHRGMPATKEGWRFFIRASRKTNRKIFNEVRTQTQVYLPITNQGW